MPTIWRASHVAAEPPRAQDDEERHRGFISTALTVVVMRGDIDQDLEQRCAQPAGDGEESQCLRTMCQRPAMRAARKGRA